MTITRAFIAATMLTAVSGAALPAAAQTPEGQTPGAQTPASDLDPRIQKLVASISEERLKQLLTKLSSFHTRNTLSDPNLPNGLGEARQWILDQMAKASPRLQVSFDTHQIPAGGRITRDTELRNIIAVLPGKSPRRIYVSGHYDSLNLGQRGQAGLNTGRGAEPQGAARGAGDAGAARGAGAGRGAGAAG
ncbi:MAG TPA: hypothetical protein VJ813_18095, partial [Vicinamibacterales bacterium]|nr:hypothetical protein [Vicinamibacterales bacterium]